MKITIKRAHRRSVALKVLNEKEAQVLAPMQMKMQDIEAFIAKHSTWILKQKAKLASQNQALSLHLEQQDFMLLGEPVYAHRNANNSIVFNNTAQDAIKTNRAVTAQLKQHAATLLQSAFESCLAKTNLKCNKLSFRTMRRSWGNCSSKKEIKLNPKLVLLPIHLLEYIIYHELCHLKHMNHSPMFWAAVAQHVPNYLQCRKELRNYGYLLSSQLPNPF